MSAASNNLRDNQRQLDMDGCEVGVSRQAICEVLTEYSDMLTALKWAAGRVGGYTRRIPGQNDTNCDAIDRMNAAISKASSNA